jgi:hypothetical protein
VYFVTGRHLVDLDLHGDLLDIFDVVRLARHTAWGEQVPFADRLHSAGILTAPDAATALMEPLLREDARQIIAAIDHDETTVRITFSDGSTIVIPRRWSGTVTELTITGSVASTLMSTTQSLRSLAAPEASKKGAYRCSQFIDVAVNQVFYRREPHMMRRYAALASENIRREPVAFVLASLYRAGRLFIVQGTSDRMTAHQFEGSRRVYAAAQMVSLSYVVMFGIGVVVALRRYGRAIVLPLLLIAYVPATLAPVLTNMRYTVTIQPLMIMFIAVAIAALTERLRTSGMATHSSG